MRPRGAGFPKGLLSSLCLPFSLPALCIPDIVPHLYLQVVLVSGKPFPRHILCPSLWVSLSASGPLGLLRFFGAQVPFGVFFTCLEQVYKETHTSMQSHICHNCVAAASFFVFPVFFLKKPLLVLSVLEQHFFFSSGFAACRILVP